MAELGVLKQAGLREAWDHEARSFTPWLCEHLGLLGDAIGMGLELVEREAQVGSFSADILAHATDDEGHRVLIENQLEGSDHHHLGQIVTYLGGLDARTVIWVAARFQEEHLSAFQWLNEHTHEDCAFFAVEVKAVRIDDSRPAPLFEVVARPNRWERQRRQEARTGLSEMAKLRQRFWEYVKTSDHESWKGIPPVASATISWSGEGRPIMERLRLSLYVFKDGVGIYIYAKRKISREQAASDLEPWAGRLCERLGVEMIVKPHESFFPQTKQGVNTADKSQWPELARWLTEKLNLYRSAIDELPAAPPAA